MRTLKKVLALSLVFAMAFTMMAGAAFKDQDKIDSSLTEDIQLLTALGVFQGDENGNFNPTDNVRRSEAAKMIYVLKNNGVDDGAVAFQGVSKYSDVPVGHWAEGYINYCTNLGYMGGWQENGVQKFDPNGNVTGVELMKMLLCMIGYKADVQGYTGNGWQTNVLVDAATSGLSVEFTPSVYAATPRQWTARLMVNAINAPYVSYNRGELQFGNATDSTKSYGEQYLGLATAEGTLISTNSNKLGSTTAVTKAISTSLNDSDKVIVKTGVDSNNNNKDVVVSALGDADDALLGQPVKMYYKVGTGTSENKVYAVMPYAKEAKVVNTTADAVEFDSTGMKVTIPGLGTKTYSSSQDVEVFWNNVYYGKGTIDKAKDVFLGINANLDVTVVADKDGYAKTILVHDMIAYGQIDKLDADKNTLSFKKISGMVYGTNNLKLDDENRNALTFDNTSDNKGNYSKYLNVASDVTAGSVVKIVANTSSGKLVYDITLADKIEATPTSYTLGTDDQSIDIYKTLTINGETYKMANASVALNGYDWKTTTSVASDKTFYTDGKYVIFSEGGTTSASVENLALITGVKVSGVTWENKTTYKVRVLLADGTAGEYTVAATYNKDGNKTTNSSNDNGVDNSLLTGVMSYSISDNKITLKALKGDSTITFAQGVQDYDHNSKTVMVSDTTKYAIDANAYFFVKSTVDGTTKYSVVKASELNKSQTSVDSATTADFAYKTVNGVKTLLFGTLDLSSSLVASDAEYAYVKTAATVTADGSNYVVSMTVADTKNEEVTIKKTFTDRTSADTDAKTWNGLRGKVITYTLTSEGNVEKIDPVSGGTANTLTYDKWNQMVIVGWNNNVANVKIGDGTAGEKLLSVASDAKIHFVDATSNSSYTQLTDGSIDGYQSKKDTLSAYAYVQKIDNVDTITDIYVEVNGDSIANIW